MDGEIRYWLDLGLEELLFAAEYDGAEWHTSQEQIERDLDRRAWLAEERGWMVEVFRQEHVFGRQQNADARLANALRAARATLARRTVVV
ncbi:MAG: hypothetical protein F2667_08790 [Actinobacteria bacterium]|nr:hypothetical protein [Actinomycetota bacterium]